MIKNKIRLRKIIYSYSINHELFKFILYKLCFSFILVKMEKNRNQLLWRSRLENTINFLWKKIIIPLNIVNNAKGKHSNKVKQLFKSKFQTPKSWLTKKCWKSKYFVSCTNAKWDSICRTNQIRSVLLLRFISFQISFCLQNECKTEE